MAVALPSIARELGTDPAGLQWTVTGFNIAPEASRLVRPH